MKKISVLVLAFSLIALFTYGFWPMSSDSYPISWSAEKQEAKRGYLQQLNKQSIQRDSSSTPPNIIIILADDLSVMDVSSYGGQFVKTKHIDQLANGGARFTNAYVSSPICAPSRAGILTGKYQQRFGFEINIHERYPKNRVEYFVYKHFIAKGNWKVDQPTSMQVPNQDDMNKQGMAPSEVLLSEFLKANNYQTACFGKWHLGHAPELRPNQMGFDYHYGFYEAFSLYAPIDQDTIINQELNDFSDPFIWNKGRTGNCAIRINDSIVQEDHYITNQIASRSIEWIKKNKHHPFFLYLPFSAPHTPFQATQRDYDLFAHIEDPKKRMYCAMIHSLDKAVGHITNSLDELSLLENTMIFFLSDNGGATYTEAADNSPFVGGKMTHFEGGVKVPFILHWKNTIKDSTIVDVNISSLDIFKTISTVLSIDDQHTDQLDGLDLIGLIQQSDTTTFKDRYLFWRAGGQKAARKGRWKMIWDDRSQAQVLYDLDHSDGEKYNQANTNTSIERDLYDNYQHWEKKMMASRWPNVMYYQFVHQSDTFRFPL